MSYDDNYVLDADGKRILIGLTLDETREFERLDELILDSGSEPTEERNSRNERRWLVFYDKHDVAVRGHISMQNAKALRGLRWEWACKG
jgi:hypothetical protein